MRNDTFCCPACGNLAKSRPEFGAGLCGAAAGPSCPCGAGIMTRLYSRVVVFAGGDFLTTQGIPNK